MKLHVFSLVAFAIWPLPQLAAGASPADPQASVRHASPRPAWAWSDEERFAALLDEAAASRRLEMHRRRETSRRGIAAASQTSTGNGLAAQAVDAIDGSRDPHLFFAWELFQQMVTGAYPDDVAAGDAYRQSKEDVRKSLGLPDDMWERMEPIVAVYRAARQQERDEALSRGGSDRNTVTTNRTAFEVCTQRHLALLEAQRTFGDAITRFLYLGVARTMHRITVRRPGDEVLRIAKGECG